MPNPPPNLSLQIPSGAILTPFGIPAHNSQQPSSLAIPIHYSLGSDVDAVTLYIRDSSSVLLNELLSGAGCRQGEHQWYWDGFNQAGVFDSHRLKSATFTAELEARIGGEKVARSTRFGFAAARQDWLDVMIDSRSKAIEVMLRGNLRDGGTKAGSKGFAASSQAGVLGDERNTEAPGPLPFRSYHDLMALAQEGVTQYWSRTIQLVTGDEYKLRVRLEKTNENAMSPISLVYNTNRAWLRSSNPGKVRGVLSLLGNLITRKRIAYNVGYVRFSKRWAYINPREADRTFAYTAAHEIGHEILAAYGGDSYSYSHRGSSTLSQKRKALGKGGLEFPRDGEIDLMKYYHGPWPKDFYQRSVASEYDVKGMISLAGVRVL